MRRALIIGLAILLLGAFALPAWSDDEPTAPEEPKTDEMGEGTEEPTDEEGVDEEGMDEEGVDEEGVDEEGVDEEGVDEEEVGPDIEEAKPDLEGRVSAIEKILFEGEDTGREAYLTYHVPKNGHDGGGFHLFTSDRLFSLYVGGLFVGEYMGTLGDRKNESRSAETMLNYEGLMQAYQDLVALVGPGDPAALALEARLIYAQYMGFADLWDERGIRPSTLHTNSFDVDKLYFHFRGHAFFRQLTYNFEFDAEGDVGLLRGYLDWESCEYATIRFGQMDVPFGRQFIAHESDLEFGRDNLTTDVFNLGQEVGIMAHDVQECRPCGSFEWWAGAWNGNGPWSSSNNQQGLMWGIRGAWYPLGYIPYVESDWDYSRDPKVGVGGAIAKRDVVDSPLGDFADRRYEVDVVGTWLGLYGQAEYFYSYQSFTGLKVKHRGWYLQAGYMVDPKRIEVLGRFEFIDWKRAATGLKDTWEAAAGAAYYWSEHNLKAVLEVGKNQSTPATRGVIDTWFVRLAAQLRW